MDDGRNGGRHWSGGGRQLWALGMSVCTELVLEDSTVAVIYVMRHLTQWLHWESVS